MRIFLIVGFGIPIFFSQTVVAGLIPGLVAYWSFDNCNALDVSGNKHHGIINGNPVCIDGWAGKAFRFDGINDFIEIPYSVELAPASYTVSLFYRADTLSLGEMITKGIDKHYYQIQFGSDHELSRPNVIEFWYEDRNDGDYFIITEEGFQIRQYFMVTMSFQNNELAAYVNGRLIERKSFLISPFDNGDRVYIGKGNNGFFSGIIDEVRIYDRALSDTEIQSLYQNRKNIFHKKNEVKL